MHGRIGGGKMALRTRIACWLLALPLALSATEWSPWPSAIYEIQLRSSVILQTYPRLSTSTGNLKRHSFNQLYRLSTSLADRYGFAYEIEGGFAHTSRRTCELDDLRITGRYFLFSDISAEDPFSLSAGVTVAGVNGVALRDYNLMHHGHMEYEFHLSVGQECPMFDTWSWRWWQNIGIGSADIGKPWLRTKTIVERNYSDCHRLYAIAETRIGLGNHKLDIQQPFDGYGTIRYRFIDLGAGYSFTYEDITLTAQYQYRVYGKYVPIQAHTATLTVLYPFGL